MIHDANSPNFAGFLLSGSPWSGLVVRIFTGSGLRFDATAARQEAAGLGFWRSWPNQPVRREQVGRMR